MSSLIYSKTTAGKQEIEARSSGLSPKLRRLLILVDGQRDISALGQLSGLTTDCGLALQQLRQAGMVVLAGEHEPVSKSMANMADTIEIPDHLLAFDQENLLAVKQLMLQSSRDHLGVLGQNLYQEISNASCKVSLRTYVAKWSLALRESRQGRLIAAEYLNRVNAVLG